jgi:hypothetical protein
MSNKVKPNWQPISALPTIAYIIDGATGSTEEQYKNFLAVQDKPYVLDDAIVNRTLRLYRAQLDNCAFYQEQLERWEKESLNPDQAKEVKRLFQRVTLMRELSQKLLDMVDKMKDETIDKIMAMDDAELALAVLSGKIKSPF